MVSVWNTSSHYIESCTGGSYWKIWNCPAKTKSCCGIIYYGRPAINPGSSCLPLCLHGPSSPLTDGQRTAAADSGINTGGIGAASQPMSPDDRARYQISIMILHLGWPPGNRGTTPSRFELMKSERRWGIRATYFRIPAYCCRFIHFYWVYLVDSGIISK